MKSIGPKGLTVCEHCKVPQKNVENHKCSMNNYDIESIENVGFDEEGDMMIQIKWKGYDQKTWEHFTSLNSEESYDLLIDWFQINKIEQLRVTNEMIQEESRRL